MYAWCNPRPYKLFEFSMSETGHSCGWIIAHRTGVRRRFPGGTSQTFCREGAIEPAADREWGLYRWWKEPCSSERDGGPVARFHAPANTLISLGVKAVRSKIELSSVRGARRHRRMPYIKTLTVASARRWLEGDVVHRSVILKTKFYEV